jgi:fermentation-respiration switch protein FrsA (DUF1100 family)
MNRRYFLQASALAPIAAPALAAGVVEPNAHRFDEQRWALDNIIHANGVDWDQPRSVYWNAPCGPEANADFAAIRTRVQKMADIGPAFESTAKRREAKAKQAEADGASITARDNWFMATIHYGAAEWPYDDSGAEHMALHQAKRACYANYARLADHHIEAVSIPLKDKAIPAWFHLPAGYTGGKIAAVISVPGMDSFKEASVSLSNDRFLARNIAVLAIDGPGQYESALNGLFVTMDNWTAAGPVLVDWLLQRPEVDPQKILLTGTSFGSFGATIIAGSEPRIAATAVQGTCLEPGFNTIFNEASPTFKRRFMWMSGYTDEDKFDQFAKTLSWDGIAQNIRSPYLVIAGEADELCPLHFTELMISKMSGPRNLMIYADSRHSVGGVPSANLGPFATTFSVDWLVARLNGKPVSNERWFVDPTGRVTKTAL